MTFVHAERWYQNCNTGRPGSAPRHHVAPGGSPKTVMRAGYGMAFDPISTFQVTSVATAVPGQTYTCSSTLGGTGAAHALRRAAPSVPDIRLGEGFPNELPLPTAKPSSFLTPPAAGAEQRPAGARVRSAT